jgi:MerR family transcriptional regulator, heat shock protein HspR
VSPHHGRSDDGDTGTSPGQDRSHEHGPAEIDQDKPLYVISVAAELVDMHPQTLRLYERKGLIEPSRSAGKTRLYSQRNIEQLREIRRLTQELGVNLAGVEEIIRLRKRLDQLQDNMEGRIANLQERLRDHMDDMRRRALPAPAEGAAEGEEDAGQVTGDDEDWAEDSV